MAGFAVMLIDAISNCKNFPCYHILFGIYIVIMQLQIWVMYCNQNVAYRVKLMDKIYHSGKNKTVTSIGKPNILYYHFIWLFHISM